MFAGNLLNLCKKKKNLEVFEDKLKEYFIIAGFFSLIVLAICIFFEQVIPVYIFFSITAVLLLVLSTLSYITDKTKNKIIKLVEEELSKGMRSLFYHIPNDERVFNVYCWRYNKNEFIIHIEVFSNEFTHDQIVEKIRPIQSDINYISDVHLNIYYCIWPAC